MTDSYLQQREASLLRAGLIVLGLAPQGGHVTTDTAWRRIASSRVKPTATVGFGEDDHLEQVDRHWLRQADDLGILSSDTGGFLISTPGRGAMDAPWAIVRLGEQVNLARHLAPVEGEPEFVTLALDGHALCGVTSEEYDVWISSIDLTA